MARQESAGSRTRQQCESSNKGLRLMDLLRSLPLGLYLEQPITWMHRLDPRVKLAWLMSFLAMPVLATPEWRLLIVGVLFGVTFGARIPARVWRQQMGWLLLLAIYVFSLVAIAPDGLSVESRPRLPANELAFVQQPNTIPEPVPPKPWYNPFQATP
ncbi:MAG TPA: CbiQ family ECF transporter T component, partial [Leptolyngbya sp.]|nr:CbiQ family ECF transporter T component [Leptolyngbya sp.]